MNQLNVKTRDGGENVESLQDELGITEAMARILSSRGVTSEADVSYRARDLEPPDAIPDVERGARRIIEAVEDVQDIFICGDFDADGATATALCMLFFRAIDYPHVEFRMPDRFKFGYGLSEQFVKSIVGENPNLIITVDNGVSSVDGIALANEHNIDVIVTDHHLPPDEDKLPEAHSIVNPNMPDSAFPSAPCGVGVVFYLLATVRRLLVEDGYFEEYDIPVPNMAQWLDLVAIGTVVDMVPLDLNNRRLVNEGIRRMRSGQVRPGIRALCERSKTRLDSLSTQDLGFRLGPRINAAGRLDDISVGVRLLITEDQHEANELADQLQHMNDRRRQIQVSMNEKAHSLVDLLDDESRKSLCVYHSEFHEGVVGLVASRLVDRSNAPAVVFADVAATTPPELKGSARSVEGVHIRDVLAYIESRHPKLILRYGGHAAAAGLSITKGNFNRFANLFEDAVTQVADSNAFSGVIRTDGELDADDFDMSLMDEIERFEPWGQAFERPVFHGTFDVVSMRTVGREDQHLKLVLKLGERHIQAIKFNQQFIDSDQVEIVYRIEKNEYAGMSTPQLIIDKIAEVV